MEEVYAAHGVRFRYPNDWELSEQRGENEVTITIASPDTSFWLLTLFFDRPQPRQVLDTALSAFREEYDEVDDYPADSNLCHRANLSRDVEFVCYQLINSAFLRVFQTRRFTALVLYQGTDHELKETLQQMEEISNTLHCDFGEDVITA